MPAVRLHKRDVRILAGLRDGHLDDNTTIGQIRALVPFGFVKLEEDPPHRSAQDGPFDAIFSARLLPAGLAALDHEEARARKPAPPPPGAHAALRMTTQTTQTPKGDSRQ